MLNFRAIIDTWPTKAAFASDIGATPQSVGNMHERDSIPSRYWTAVVEHAQRREIAGVTLETMASLAAGRKAAA